MQDITGDVKIALPILKRAMGMEQEGRQFYLKAVQTTLDKKGQEMFAALSGDEQNHYDLIKRQYDALANEGNWISSAQIKPVKIDLGKPLFPKGKEELEKAVTEKSGDWDALLFGLDIEIKSYDLYRQAALEVNDPSGKRMFEFLAGEEQGHFNILMMRYDALFGPISWRY